jgi:HPt (histidine-containing phosphotransfer) domain-containing protein
MLAAGNDWQYHSRLRFRGTQIGSINRVSMESPSVPAIDMRTITDLADADESGDKFIAEIIEVFLADLRERVRTIGSQMRNNDHAGIAATAHAIKGSCGHFGAEHLMKLSRELEDQARSKQSDQLQAALDSMVAETERVRAALEAYRSDHAPQ